MRIKVIIPTLVITLIVGILIGQSVIAGGVTPGSQADPLVTKAFVENALNSQITQLQQQVAQLQSQANALQQQVVYLENQLGVKAPVQNPTRLQIPIHHPNTKQVAQLNLLLRPNPNKRYVILKKVINPNM